MSGAAADGAFDQAVANFMLYHVAHLDRALAELVGRDLGDRRTVFMRENGAELLGRHYDDVRMIDLPATVEMSADDMCRYIANSVAHRHLADRVPDFEGVRTVTASTAVFVATRAS